MSCVELSVIYSRRSLVRARVLLIFQFLFQQVHRVSQGFVFFVELVQVLLDVLVRNSRRELGPVLVDFFLQFLDLNLAGLDRFWATSLFGDCSILLFL